MSKNKNTFLEKMGLKPVERLSKKICLERVRFLRRRIENDEFRGKLLVKAKYYAAWYGWMAKNGGHRGSRRAA